MIIHPSSIHLSLSLGLSVSRSLSFVLFVVLSRKKKTKSRAQLRSSSRCCYCCYSAISFCFFHLCLVVSRIACISDLRLLGNAIAASFVWKIWRFLQHLMSKGAVLFGRDERRRRGRRGKQAQKRVDRAGCELVQCCCTVYNNFLWHLLGPWKLKHFREIAFQLCVTGIILVLNLSLLLRVLLSFPFWSVLIDVVSMRMLLQFNFLFSRSLVKQLDQCELMF